jgi:SAM-dependent methyltransferase
MGQAPSEAAQELQPSARQEIDAIQLNSLGRLIPRNRTTFLHRVASRLDEDFFGQSVRKKIQFFAYGMRWSLQRARSRLTRRHPPASLVQLDSPGLRVAVHGTGSLGDFCTHMMFVQEFYRKYGPMEIDFYCHPKKVEDAKFLFSRVRFVRNVVNVNFLPALEQNYDLIVYIRYIVKYGIINHTRILQHNASLLNAIGVSQTRFEPYHFIFDSHPYLDGVFARSIAWQKMNLADAVGQIGNVSVNRTTIPFLAPDVAAYGVLERHGLARASYITVHDGYDTSYLPLSTTVTKCWPIYHWNRLVALLKQKFPDILVVQVGADNSRPIEGVDRDLRNRTTLDEVAWVIKQSLLHIDGESGLVRLSHALHTRSVVLFGPTSKTFFGIDAHINLSSEKCSDCWWATQGWLSQCPRGLETPECMDSITPERVAEHVQDHFDAQRPTGYQCEMFSLYGDGTADRAAGFLADLFRKLYLTPVPISKHTTNKDSGIYLHASKQWEYAKAWDVISVMSEQLGRPLKIADVGGGRGALSPYLAIKGHDVEVFDLDYLWDHGGDPGIENRFQKWAARNGLKCSYGSLFNIPAEGGAYDVVLSVSVLEHVPHKDFALKEALRLLRPGGKLFLSFDFAVEAASIEDRLRVEIFTPERLQEAIGSVEVSQIDVSEARVRQSARRIQQDAVAGIPIGMTVASLVLKRD